MENSLLVNKTALFVDSDESASYFKEFLVEKHLEPMTCLQKLVCWMVKKSRKKVAHANGGSVDKIIDGLVSNEWLRYFLNGSVLKEGIDDGIQGANCAKVYSACKISRSDLEVFTNNLFGEFD